MSDQIKIQSTDKGLHRDFNIGNQPDNSYRYALNSVNQTLEGDFGTLSNEGSNYEVCQLKEGYIPIGYIHIGNNVSVIFSCNGDVSEIGLMNEKETYTPLINTKVLNFSEKHPIRSVFRVRKNAERVIYFVDGLNKPRCINIDRLSNYYSTEYQEWLDVNNETNTFNNEKWSSLKFNLVKTYEELPVFNNAEVLQTGNIKAGSYSFGIIYVDEDLNSTNVITTSNPINIFNDNVINEFSNIRGSRNIQSALMGYTNTNKSIKLSIGNLDIKYPFYKVVILQANEMTGKVNKALVSELISNTESTYIYYGNDEQLEEIDLASVEIEKSDIDSVEFIEQIENRLILGKYKTKNIDFCDFQRYASKIKSHLTKKRVYLNSVKSNGNCKNPVTPFNSIGYLSGEVYSFGIVYIFKDGSVSPAYHIPGRNEKDIRPISNNFDDNFDYYETPDSKYPEIHICTDRKDYWGKDNYGESLTGNSKRFHKFPSRKSRNLPLYSKEKDSIEILNYHLSINIKLKEGKEYPVNVYTNDPLIISCIVEYTKENSETHNEHSIIITDETINKTINVSIYSGDTQLKSVNGDYGVINGEILKYINYFDISFEYSYSSEDILNPAYFSDIYGIRFDNIEIPHPDIVGYFIVRNERTESDKLIIDNALFGPLTAYTKESVQYKVFNKWVNACKGETVKGSVRDIDKNSLYFFAPEHQFNHNTLKFDHIDIQGYFDTVKMTSINNGEPPDTSDYDNRKYCVVVSDCMEGTSYNPEVHATADHDGFNLIIGYRNSTLSYHTLNINIDWSYDSDGNSTIKNVMYLDAASSKFYDGKTYYNACQDNKIGVIEFNEDTKLFNTSAERNIIFGDVNTRLYYGSLVVDNNTAYSNFIDRDYFKEHNNMISFKENGYGNTQDIYNGDAYVNANTVVASTYYGMKMANRKKKDKKCSGILGIALLVIGVVVTIFTAGAAIGVFGALSTASSIALSTLGAMALSAGASMYSAHLQLENLKKMIQEDYPNGLEDAINDRDISSHASNSYPYGCGLSNGTVSSDDSIAWFSDRLTDLFLESTVNTGLRTSLTSVGIDFINALNPIKRSAYNLADGTKVTTPTYVNMDGFDESEFRAYLTEKLTTIDADRGDGRLYRGYAHTEWYDVNPDHIRKNREKTFIHLPISYSCCNKDKDFSQKYNNRLLYSQQSFQEEQTDNYRIFLPNNYKDLEGECGPISGIWRFKDDLFIHTSEGLWKLPQNLQERVNSSLTTYIGTGEFFSISPRKIEDGTTSYGSQSDFSTVFTKGGIIFVNQNSSEIYYYNGQGIENISDKGMKTWFKENLPVNIKNQLYNLVEYEWSTNNPIIGSGIIAAFDPDLNRVLFTKKDYKFINENNFVGQLSLDSTSYKPNDIFIKEDVFYIVREVRYTDVPNISFDKFIENPNILITNVKLGDNVSDVEKVDDNYIEYTPVEDFTGNDIIKVTTDKHTYSDLEDDLIICVKDTSEVEGTFPYTSGDITTNNDYFYKETLVFPISESGTLSIVDKITVPHEIRIEYSTCQKFIINNYKEVWNKELNVTNTFYVNYETDINEIKIIIEVKWENPYDNLEYNKLISYDIDYDT